MLSCDGFHRLVSALTAWVSSPRGDGVNGKGRVQQMMHAADSAE
jgi:hypothetical protein